jgi:hypothetical protein
MPFELEDQSWFPAWMRRHQMEYLSFLALHFKLYQPALPALQHLLRQQPAHEWIDCCSGAGGPALYLAAQSGFNGTMLLTDKHLPHPDASNPSLPFLCQKLDVLEDPIAGYGLVTMFNAFHHFDATDQQKILEKIAGQGRPFLIVEITRPILINFLMVTIAGILGQLLLAPFVSPFSWKRLLFTYLIPIHLITVTWDGWMSVIHAIPNSRFTAIVSELQTQHFRIHFEQAGPWWRKLAILSGQAIS